MIKVLLLVLVLLLGATVAGCGRGRVPGSGDDPSGPGNQGLQYPYTAEEPVDVYFGPQAVVDEDEGEEPPGPAGEAEDAGPGADREQGKAPVSEAAAEEDEAPEVYPEPPAEPAFEEPEPGSPDAPEPDEDDGDELYFDFDDDPVPVYYGADFLEEAMQNEEDD